MPKRLMNVIAIVAFAFTINLFVVNQPAQAATTGWPQDISAVSNDYVQSMPNGSVMAANCSEAQTAVEVFSASGTLSSSVPQRTDGLYAKSCDAQGAIDKDGTVFGVADNSSNQFAAVAYRGTAKLWEQHFRSYCASQQKTFDRAISRVLVGADGFVYVATIPYQCPNGFYLSKLDASTGQVVFEKKVSNYTIAFLGVSSNGLVSQDNAGVIRYYRYDGTDFAPAVAASGRVQSVDMNSRAFVTGTSADSCSTSTFQMYTPNKATPFNFTVPACWYLQQVQATSGNGVAVLARNQDHKPALVSYTPAGTSGFTARSVTLGDTDGYRSFLVPNSPYAAYLPMYINTDVNGNILLEREYSWQQGSNSLTGWQFTLQSSDLNIVSQYDTGAFDFQQTSHFARTMHAAMANDRLYIAIGYCTSADPRQCGTQSDTLYAVRMARLGMDYPRGAVLGVSATKVTCKTVDFVGVRGSGEDAFAYEGLGQTLQTAKNQLVAAGVKSMEVVAVPYPAVRVDLQSPSYPANYSTSVTSGVNAFAGALAEINKDCPGTQILIVGYSQGAQVVGDTLGLLPAKIQNQIKAIVLFGDPLFNPKLIANNKGTFDTGLYGIWTSPFGHGTLPVRQFPASMTNRAASYCVAGDAICNFTPAAAYICMFQPLDCPHFYYAPDWTQQAATWMRSRFTP